MLFLLVICQRMVNAHQDVLPFMLSVEKAHPGDIYANLGVAKQMADRKNWSEAIRYYQAAVAIKPNCTMARNGLGFCMISEKRYPDAIRECRECIRLDAQAADPHEFLGVALCRTGAEADGLEEMRTAIRLSPKSAGKFATLGEALGMRRTVTRKHVKHFSKRSPWIPDRSACNTSFAPPCFVRSVTRKGWRRGRPNSNWRQTPRHGTAMPSCASSSAMRTVPTACLSLLDRFGNSPDAGLSDRIGRACLLSTACDEDQLRLATACVDRSLVSEKAIPHGYPPYFEFSKALADYRNGQFAEAAAVLRRKRFKSARPRSKAPFRNDAGASGNPDAAHDLLRQAIESFDSASKLATDHEEWIYKTCETKRKN